jgi:hypothetical protein
MISEILPLDSVLRTPPYPMVWLQITQLTHPVAASPLLCIIFPYLLDKVPRTSSRKELA